MATDNPILIQNVYYMLSYAFQALRKDQFTHLGSEEFDNIHELLGEIFSLGLNQLTKRGLERSYIEFTDDLPAIRGKVDLRGTIQNQLARRTAVACTYDEFSTDHELNQIINSTARLVLSSGKLRETTSRALKRSLLHFSGVSTIDLTHVSWGTLRIHRNNQIYALLIQISKFICDGLLLTQTGESKLANFIDDQQMSRLYEKFLLEFYKKHFPELKPQAKHIPWAVDDDNTDFLPTMKSDIYLTWPDKVLIIDAKYYGTNMQSNWDKKSIISANLYQIFTYVKNAEREEELSGRTVSGMLLYARTTDPIQPEGRYEMDGNRVSVTNLDLGNTFEEIRRNLIDIAYDLPTTESAEKSDS